MGKIPWGREWQSTPLLLPGKSHGERSLAGCNPRGFKRVGHNVVTNQQPTPPPHSPVSGLHCHSDASRQTHILTCVQHHPKPHSWDQGVSSLGHSGTFGSDFMPQMVSGVLIYFMLYTCLLLFPLLASFCP